MNKLILPLFLFAIGLSSTAQAEIYKWTDSDGKVHYSATPPQDTKAKAEQIGEKIKFNVGKIQPTTEIQEKPAAEAPASGETETSTDEASKKNLYEGDRSQARIAYCKNLQNNIHILENGKNRKIVEEGSSQPLEVDERSAHLEKAKSDLEKHCQGI